MFCVVREAGGGKLFFVAAQDESVSCESIANANQEHTEKLNKCFIKNLPPLNFNGMLE
jgi:hypothetical protein